MNRSTRAGRALAVAGAVALVLTACSGSSDDAGAEETADGGTGGPLLIGTVLPVTGSLEQLGPPEIGRASCRERVYDDV